MIAVFLLRIDSVTNQGEGEVYYPINKGFTGCDMWSSPKLTDHKVIIANGKKAIEEVYKLYNEYRIYEKRI